MEIKNTLNKLDPYINRAETEKGAQRPAADASGSAAPAGDTVSFKSQTLKAAVTDAAQSAPDVRQSKVDAIKASIADGSYQIDSKAIAGKMLQAAREQF